MKNIGIIYFSGTGNTKFVANMMKRELESKNYEVDLINIENSSINYELYDEIVIGGPVYVDRYPEILLSYLEKELKGYSNRCMLYTTQASSKVTATFGHAIKRLGFLKITYCEFITMPNNFYNIMFKETPEERKVKLIDRAKLKSRLAINSFIDNKIRIYPTDLKSIRLAERIYKLYYPFCVKLTTKKITIDKNLCIRCRYCEINCPVNCLKINDKVNFNNKCTFCQRCLNSCPKNAFLYKNKKIIQYKPNFMEGQK